MKKKLDREGIKTAVLVALTAMAVVLIYLGSVHMRPVVQSEALPAIRSDMRLNILRPDSIFYSRGNCEYSRLYDNRDFYNLWSDVVDFLDNFVRFPYDFDKIERADFIDALEEEGIYIKNYHRFEVEPSEGQLIFAKELFICKDGIYINAGYFDDKYLKVDRVPSQPEQQRLAEIFMGLSEIKGLGSYRRMMDVSNVKGSQNYYPIPTSYRADIVKMSTKLEFDPSDSNALNALAKNVLGERLDFTQVYVDSERSSVFLHDRGESLLTFKQDGSIIYRRKEPDTAGAGAAEASIEQSLSAAVNMIMLSGGMPEGAYLKRISSSAEGEYVFEFGYKLSGQYDVVSVGDSLGISVSTSGNVVTSMSRRILVPNKDYPPEALQFYEIMNFIEDMTDRDVVYSSHARKEHYAKICEKIDEVNLVFFESMGELMPAWEIRMGSEKYLLDAITGKQYSLDEPIDSKEDEER